MGTTHLGMPGGGGAPLCPPRCPPPVVFGSSNSHLSYKKSSQSFVPIRELLFLHKNNTMAVLLKIVSVRVSFIQIMQIMVQNKTKSVRKSRYGRDVSACPVALPSPCLPSSLLPKLLGSILSRKNRQKVS